MTARNLAMRDWEDKLDAFLQLNEREVLTHAGKPRACVADKLEAAPLTADAEYLAALEQAERALEGKERGKKK